jgi:HEAT repeat protein
MKKRLLIVAILIAIISLGIALVIPRSHFAIMGLVHGEVFYDGRPVSYWSGAFRKDRFVGDLGDVGKTLREGGPAAVPVLCRLLADEDDQVRSQALIALRLIDFDPNYVAPTLTRMFVRERAGDFVVRAIGQLADRDPAVFARELQWALAEEPGPERRAEIGLVLGMLGQEGWTSALQVTLDQGSPFLKVQAANAWWRGMHDAAVVLPIVIECLPDVDPKTQGSAEKLLLDMAPVQKDAVRSCLIELSKHKDAAVRARAARLLLETARQTGRNAATVEACLSALHDVAAVRREAAAVLVRMGPLDKPTHDQLRRMLSEPDIGTRLSAAAILVLENEDADTAVVQALVEGLTAAPDAADREQAASTLGTSKAGFSPAVAALIRTVENDSSHVVRSAAIKALGEIGPPAKAGIGTLIKLVEQTEYRNDRVDAARALGLIARDEEPLKVLLAALATPGFHELRAETARALGNIGCRRRDVGTALTKAMDDSDTRVRCQAAVSLWKLNPENQQPVERLIEQLRVVVKADGTDTLPASEIPARQGPTDATSVIVAIGNIGPRAADAVPLLIQLVDRDNFVAIETLKSIGPVAKAAVPAIQKMLASKYPSTRCQAASALWSIGRDTRMVMPVLVEALNDANEWTRRTAAETLQQIGPPAAPAVPALRALLNDDDPSVRRAARKALRAITPKSLSLLGGYPFMCIG